MDRSEISALEVVLDAAKAMLKESFRFDDISKLEGERYDLFHFFTNQFAIVENIIQNEKDKRK